MGQLLKFTKECKMNFMEQPFHEVINGLKAQVNAEKTPEQSLQHFLRKDEEITDKLFAIDIHVNELRQQYDAE
eukprot:15088594-Alexandrium_andersonii.AAC.1